jgi:hypothetical protein
MMKSGSLQAITARGCWIIMDSMNKFGVLVMECLLMQELPPAECVLNDGQSIAGDMIGWWMA